MCKVAWHGMGVNQPLKAPCTMLRRPWPEGGEGGGGRQDRWTLPCVTQWRACAMALLLAHAGA